MALIYAEMEPGDGLFFHCNTLHRSAQNQSADRRWTMICCYHSAANDPYRAHHHAQYTPMQKVADSAIKAAGARHAGDGFDDALLQLATAPAELTRPVGALFHSD